MKAEAVEIDLTHPVVMTILNVTPDSFFEGSRRVTTEQVIRGAEKALSEGTTIIDVGGYSSRPGADDVSPEEELQRVALGVECVRRLSKDVVVSIDTFRASVVRQIVEQFGSCIVNDISAGELDPQMIPTVASHNLPYIAMHMRSTPAMMQQHTDYDDVTREVKQYFREKLTMLRDSGISNIIIDPGFGFAKNIRQNYELLRNMGQLLALGAPLLAGISRKSMIYKVLDTTPADALIGTTALHWQALQAGARILRVHDTREAMQVVKLFNYYNGE